MTPSQRLSRGDRSFSSHHKSPCNKRQPFQAFRASQRIHQHQLLPHHTCAASYLSSNQEPENDTLQSVNSSNVTTSSINNIQISNGTTSKSNGTTTDNNNNTSIKTSSTTKATNENDVLIEFRDVYKSFGSKQILRGASFKIRRGEAVGIIGSSGTGKSTTLRLAAGLLQPDKGEVLIKGEPRHGLISDDDTSNKLKVGLVFQSGALFDSLTVKENVGFMLYEHTDLPLDVIDKAVAQSLSKVGLSGVENLYPSELSGGMKKRVALARAIVSDNEEEINALSLLLQSTSDSSINNSAAGMNADKEQQNKTMTATTTARLSNSNNISSHQVSSAEQLIMYDEPTAGLDPVASTVIEDLIRSLHDPDSTHYNNHSNIAHTTHTTRSNTNTNDDESRLLQKRGGITSYVVVTHQHSTIRRAVDRIIFLHDGKVVWEGSVDEFDTTDEPIVRQFASGSLKGPIVYV